MKIKVQRRHIRDGVQWDWSACPIALAITEVLGVGDVSVGQGVFRCGNTNFGTSRRAERFIERFDDGKAVKPFVFELKI
jgi:hypothetical protein